MREAVCGINRSFGQKVLRTHLFLLSERTDVGIDVTVRQAMWRKDQGKRNRAKVDTENQDLYLDCKKVQCMRP